MSDGIWLIRHGALPPNPLRRMVGARDIPMSPAGYAQVRLLAAELECIKDGHIVAIITSSLQRCRETARILHQAFPSPLPLHVEPDICEISLGDWEGRSREEICRLWPGAYATRGLNLATFVPPGGESFRMLQRRVLYALIRWRRRYPQGNLFVVTHAGVMRALLAHWLALPLQDALRIPLSYACYCYLPYEHNQHIPMHTEELPHAL